jgi:hypothetical protein
MAKRWHSRHRFKKQSKPWQMQPQRQITGVIQKRQEQPQALDDNETFLFILAKKNRQSDLHLAKVHSVSTYSAKAP